MITLLKLDPEQIPIANMSNIAKSMDMDVYDIIIKSFTDSQREFMLFRIRDTVRLELVEYVQNLK